MTKKQIELRQKEKEIDALKLEILDLERKVSAEAEKRKWCVACKNAICYTDSFLATQKFVCALDSPCEQFEHKEGKTIRWKKLDDYATTEAGDANGI